MGMSSHEHFILSKSIAHNSNTLRAAVKLLIKRLEVRANSLNKKSRTKADRGHWQARGRQELLRCVANCLQQLCTKYSNPYILYLAFKDYLGCLEKIEIDVEEEKKISLPGSGCPFLQWKAEGAARELPTVFADLMYLLTTYPPLIEKHVLSLDGNSLVPLQREDEKEQQEAIPDEEVNRKEMVLILI